MELGLSFSVLETRLEFPYTVLDARFVWGMAVLMWGYFKANIGAILRLARVVWPKTSVPCRTRATVEMHRIFSEIPQLGSLKTPPKN